MRTFFFVALLTVGLAPPARAQYPLMQTAQTEYDLGTFREEAGPQVARFPFTNTGSGDGSPGRGLRRRIFANSMYQSQNSLQRKS